jgi:hypothetical protein
MNMENEIRRLAEGLKMSDPTKDSKGNPVADLRWSGNPQPQTGNPFDDPRAAPSAAEPDRRLRASPPNPAGYDSSAPPFGRLGDQVKEPAPTRPTGGTVLEALEKLQTHAVAILNDAKELEGELTGQPVSKDADDAVKAIGGIWDRLAAQIVMIERVFSQIDEAHAHAQASLK